MLVLSQTFPTEQLLEVEVLPPACVDCNHYLFEAGSWCRRPSTVDIFNVVSGVYSKHSKSSYCPTQRYGTDEACCGIAGRFFEPKE